MKTIQFYLTPAEGKKLIAKGIASRDDVQYALKNGTILIIGGTTNAAVAEELLNMVGEAEGFDKQGFFRGLTLPKGAKVTPHKFIGDVVIEKGKWIKGKTVFDVADNLKKGDIVFKGANAVNLKDAQGAVLLGGEGLGTAGPAITAACGRRVNFIVPVGVEKRVEMPLHDLQLMCNNADTTGLKFLPLPGEVYTELDAILDLTGAMPEILAAGGVCGAEGGCYFLASGEDEEIEELKELLKAIEKEPAFTL